MIKQFVQLIGTSQQFQMDSYCRTLKNRVLLSVRRCHMTGTARPSVSDLVSPTEIDRQFFTKMFRTNLSSAKIRPRKVRTGQAVMFPVGT